MASAWPCVKPKASSFQVLFKILQSDRQIASAVKEPSTLLQDLEDVKGQLRIALADCKDALHQKRALEMAQAESAEEGSSLKGQLTVLEDSAEPKLAGKVGESEATHHALLAERDSAHAKLQQQVRLPQFTTWQDSLRLSAQVVC